jgi:hypothetical protein
MVSYNNLLVPLRGEVVRVLTASNGADEFCLIVEAEGSSWYIAIYRWDEGWMYVGEYRMGHEGRVGHVEVIVGTIVDVGTSISAPESTMLVVELAADGFWYILYSVGADGRYVMEELLSEIHLASTANETLED